AEERGTGRRAAFVSPIIFAGAVTALAIDGEPKAIARVNIGRIPVHAVARVINAKGGIFGAAGGAASARATGIVDPHIKFQRERVGKAGVFRIETDANG